MVLHRGPCGRSPGDPTNVMVGSSLKGAVWPPTLDPDQPPRKKPEHTEPDTEEGTISCQRSADSSHGPLAKILTRKRSCVTAAFMKAVMFGGDADSLFAELHVRVSKRDE
eukprot:1051898-Amphidinium_carterae.2